MSTSKRPAAAVDDELRGRGFGGFGGLGKRPCLLIVDMTVAFTSPESPLFCDDEGAVAAISELLEAAREASVPVIYTTVVVGPKERADAQHFLRKMPALLSIADDPAGSRIDERLEPRPNEPVLEKIYPSAFSGTPLATLLDRAHVDTVIVTGMSTSGCVRASAVDVLQHGYRPVVPREAVADRDDYAHESALRDLELKYADVIPAAEVVDYLRACRWRPGDVPFVAMETTDASGLDQERFAELMAVLASGVAVVTTRAGGGAPKGLTTTAVCSASADPPLLLTCIDRNSRTLPALREAEAFVVNFMRTGQEELCRRFASKRDDKFDHVDWGETESGLPVLRDVIAWTECRTIAEYDAGDHVILLGHIEVGEVPEGDWGPLVYYRRDWGMWHPKPATPGGGSRR